MDKWDEGKPPSYPPPFLISTPVPTLRGLSDVESPNTLTSINLGNASPSQRVGANTHASSPSESLEGRPTISASYLAGWIAPVATMIAAIMTAANLGSRVTGWGFVVFMIGSVAWSAVAIGTGQTNLLWTNGFLTIVNLIGIWRWLGREARHEDGREAAASRSAENAGVATLFGVGSIVGLPLAGLGGVRIGTIVDGMMRCDDRELAYLVVSEGGVAGVGERLHAVDPWDVQFSSAGARCDLTLSELKSLVRLEPGQWPARIPDRRINAQG